MSLQDELHNVSKPITACTLFHVNLESVTGCLIKITSNNQQKLSLKRGISFFRFGWLLHSLIASIFPTILCSSVCSVIVHHFKYTRK